VNSRETNTRKPKRLRKYAFIVGSICVLLAIILAGVVHFLGLWHYVSLLAQAAVQGERSVVVQGALEISVPGGWLPYNPPYCEGFRTMDPVGDFRWFVEDYPESLESIRAGGTGSVIGFYDLDALLKHAKLGKEFETWRGRPDEWRDMSVGGLDARYAYTLEEYYSDGSDFVRGYVHVPEKNIVLFFALDHDLWDLWEEVLSKGHWVRDSSAAPDK
jgi:hypothetical protein